MGKVIVGLSGGVDSAVAALRLVQAGYDVEGLFMANWDGDDAYCTLAQDFQDARAVCQELGIVLHRVNFAAQYRDQVFDYFLREYRAGRTPNPDVLCNREIKFGVCWQYVRRLGGQHFATGHYARLLRGADGGIQLHKALDLNKDQSYFLHAVARKQFESVLFPLGELDKSAVRDAARRAGLPNHAKPDSTGICFIGERPFAEFLAQWLPDRPGPVVDEHGTALGEHRGLSFYTLGQRGGLQLGGRAGYAESPWYVAEKIAQSNTIVVVQGHDHERLQSTGCELENMHWLANPAANGDRVSVKLRYRQADQSAVWSARGPGQGRLQFVDAQRAVTPGQFAVIYAGTHCLGGGVIARTHTLAAAEPTAAIISAHDTA